MRISDWSSDVCSSDLLAVLERPDEQAAGLAPVGGRARLPLEQRGVTLREAIVIEGERLEVRPGRDLHPDARGVSLFLLGLCPRLCLGFCFCFRRRLFLFALCRLGCFAIGSASCRERVG